jgi:hypothetical protein
MSDILHTYVIQQCRGTGKFVGHKHSLFIENGYQTKHCSLIWHLTFREGTTKNILAFQIALRLKRVFSNRKTLRFLKDMSVDARFYSHCWDFVRSRDLCLLLHSLCRHTNISHSFVASTNHQTSDWANFQSLCIIVFFISSPRHTYLLPTNGII